MSGQDNIQRFLLPHGPIRGAFVHLTQTYQTIQKRQAYPESVRDWLGQALMASVLFNSTLKYSGKITFQAQGDGALSLLLAQCTHERMVRGTAKWTDKLADQHFVQALGDGKMAITIDPGEGQNHYQGIVGLKGNTLIDTLQHYFLTSQQLATHLHFACNDKHAVGLLLQIMPGGDPEQQPQYWEHITTLTQTLTDAELLQHKNDKLLHMLYHQELVQLFDAESVCFHCSCSRERISKLLASMPEQELNDELALNGHITATCDFCGQQYIFDSVDVKRLFVKGFWSGRSDSQQH